MKKLRVTIEGKSYEVLVEVLDEATLPAGSTHSPLLVPPPQAELIVPTITPSQSATPISQAGVGEVICPLSGKVVSIETKLGDLVKEGDRMATVEAMKMNTYVFASCSGKVAEISVSVGNAVEEGTRLFRLS